MMAQMILEQSLHKVQGKLFKLCKVEDGFWYSVDMAASKLFHSRCCEFKTKRQAMDYTRFRMKVLRNKERQ